MSSAWHTISIKDLGRVVTGRTPSSSNPEHFGSSYPFITPSDISLDNRHIETERYISEEGKVSLAKILLPKGAVCFVCIGATIGKICVTSRPSFTNQQINSVVVDESRHDSRFAFYALSLQGGNAKALAGGAATPIINKSAFSEIEIEVPDLPTQRKIAGILSAYDDLIENNLRRIKILEEMAQSLYREWFVHFRFPGHESARFVDSDLGQIPKGWEVKKLGECTSYLSRGLAPKYDDIGKSVVINQKCIRNERLTLDQARRQSKPIPQDKLIRRGDVLVNSTGVGTLGRVAQVEFDPCHHTVDTHVTIVRPKPEVDSFFFGQALFSLQETFDRLGAGATGQTELSRTSIAEVNFVIPPTEIQSKYGSIVTPIREAANTHRSQNKVLRRTRDLLLPKLLGGG